MKIKLSIKGAVPSADLSQYTGEGPSYRGHQFIVNEACDEADFWFVLEGVEEYDRSCRVPREHLIFLSAETAPAIDWYERSPSKLAYLAQFSHVYTHYFVPLPNVHYALPFLGWMVNANHGDSLFYPHDRNLHFFKKLRSLPKNQRLSMICSSQTWTPGHRLRLRFAEALKKHFGDHLDWYGNGIQTIPEKWEALAPYEYTIVLENQLAPGVLTEKLIDPFLCLTYPLYWGAPDADQYFPPDSFSRINALDFNESIRLIEIALAVPYANRIASLNKAKEVALGELHFLSRIVDICEDLNANAGPNAPAPEMVTIRNPSRWERLDSRSAQPGEVLGSVLGKVAQRLRKV